jgi:hypothetical protein
MLPAPLLQRDLSVSAVNYLLTPPSSGLLSLILVVYHSMEVES